jgi:DNA polymerase-3 subunit delta
VVVVHSATKSRKTLERLMALTVPGGTAHIECRAPKRGRETREFLTGQASRAGRRLAADAADALALAVGTETALLVGALEQVLADFPDDPVTAGDVATMFTGVAEVTGFGFADAVWGRNPRAALVQYRWGEQTNSLSLPAATGAAAAGLRSMVRVRSAPRGMSEADVARLAGVQSFKVRALREQGSAWSDQELAAAVVALARTDAAVKGGIQPGENLDPGQKGHALERWVRVTGGIGTGEPGDGVAVGGERRRRRG